MRRSDAEDSFSSLEDSTRPSREEIRIRRSRCMGMTLMIVVLLAVLLVIALVLSTTQERNKVRQQNMSDEGNKNVPTISPGTAKPTYSPTPFSTGEGTREDEMKPRLVAMGEPLVGLTNGDEFGWSVCLSDSGEFLAVGSPGYDSSLGSNSGLVQTYGLEESEWNPLEFNMTGFAPGQRAGTSISMSGDGRFLAVSAPRADDKTGYVQVYQYIESDGWWQPHGSQLRGVNPRDFFGETMSMSRDGQRLAITSRKYARIYTFRDDEGDWSIMENVFLNNTFLRLALSGDGQTLAVANPQFESGTGLVQIYKYNENDNNPINATMTSSSANNPNWTQIGPNITGEDTNQRFGSSLAFSHDGSRIIIGTFGANYAKIFQYSQTDDDWILLGSPLATPTGYFGFAVSISNDGELVVVGAPFYDSEIFTNRGMAKVYYLTSARDGRTVWKQIGMGILGNDSNDQAGFSVSLSGNGRYVAVGARGEDFGIFMNKGNVTLFQIEM